MNAGFSATVYNRTMSKTDPLKEKGAKVAGSPKEVAEDSDLVFTIVGFPSDVREVILGPMGVLAGLRKGGIVVDMTTSEPTLAKEIYASAKAKGIHSVDAPVSGGDVGAREAQLSIMIGGDEAVVRALEPLFNAMGKNVVYMGPAGSGQHTKAINQILVAGTMMGVVEGLLYGYGAGLDLETVIDAVGAGAAGSWLINNLGPRIAKRNFDPGFFVEHFIKDMGIALQEAQRMNMALPALALAHQLYIALKAQGHGRLGTQALALALEAINKCEMTQE
jgi:3-hydroxyisobutyrate dehydrogenase